MASRQERPCFTVGVFQDAAWAARGLAALTGGGVPAASLSILTRPSPEAAALVKTTFGVDAESLMLPVSGLGEVVAHGPLVDVLQGDDNGLGAVGVAATIRRAGFQAHDGVIYETLASRGGILVAIEGEPRAADALALLHAYGGGNAAIGAWRGRV